MEHCTVVNKAYNVGWTDNARSCSTTNGHGSLMESKSFNHYILPIDLIFWVGYQSYSGASVIKSKGSHLHRTDFGCGHGCIAPCTL